MKALIQSYILEDSGLKEHGVFKMDRFSITLKRGIITHGTNPQF